MKNNKRKGFTLTELIIVIVIIGILAAVLIPSISGYIKKAKISKGEQEAREMNTILAAEAIYQDKEYFDPYEVVKLIEESNFKLESQLKEYRFWYDASENKVKYLPMEKAFSNVGAASNTFTNDCIEALSVAHPEYRYIDSYDDELTKVVTTVRYLVDNALKDAGLTSNASITKAEMKTVLGKMDKSLNDAAENVSKIKIDGITNDIKTSIVNYTKTFDTTKSIYVDNNTVYNRAFCVESENELLTLSGQNSSISYQPTTNSVSLEIEHMVFTTDIQKVPTSVNTATIGTKEVNYELVIIKPITIPMTVTTISNGAFTNIAQCVGLIVSDTAIIDPEALNDVAKASLSEKKSNVKFITLFLNTDFTISYENAEAKLTDGSYVYKDAAGEIKSLSNIKFDDNLDDDIISKYLIPSIKFNTTKVDFSKIEKCIIRRSLLENICTYTAILIDSDLNCYKVESFGYIIDIDWKIEQDFITKDDLGNKIFGSKFATITIYLPTYVYNYINFKGACMEVVIKPQCIESRESFGVSGTVNLYDGTALVGQPYTFTIEEGIYNSELDKYVYTRTIEDLDKLPIEAGKTCNQISIHQISIFTYDSPDKSSNDKNYLFERNYK